MDITELLVVGALDPPTMSVVTDQGTAMPEATLCPRHYETPSLRRDAEAAAQSAEDYPGVTLWRDTTGNDAVECIACPSERTRS